MSSFPAFEQLGRVHLSYCISNHEKHSRITFIVFAYSPTCTSPPAVHTRGRCAGIKILLTNNTTQRYSEELSRSAKPAIKQ